MICQSIDFYISPEIDGETHIQVAIANIHPLRENLCDHFDRLTTEIGTHSFVIPYMKYEEIIMIVIRAVGKESSPRSAHPYP